MKRTFRWLFSAALSIILVIESYGAVSASNHFAAPKTYYVSLNGNDSNPGTAAAPFKTFTKAAAALAPGDELQIFGGTYTQPLTVSKSGTASAYITIKPVPGEKVILDAGLTSVRAMMLTGSYLNVEGLEIQRAKDFCVDIQGNYITVRNLNVHHCNATGLRVKGKNVIVESSSFHDNITENLNGAKGSWGIAARVTLGAENVTFRNNQVYNNWGEGLGAGQAKFINFYNNVIHDNYSVNLYIDNASDINIENNFVYNTDARFFRDGKPANCISLGEETYSGWGAQLARIRIVNNIAFFCKRGIGYTYSEVSGGGMDTVTIANNTVWGTTDMGIVVINAPAKTRNSIIANNIVQQPSNRLADIQVTSGITFKNNFWVNASSAPKNAAGTGDQFGDVKLASTPGASASSYRLSASSPAINAAAALNILTDFEGKTRGPRFDIGAIQYSGNVNTPASPTPTNSATSTPTSLPTNTPVPTSLNTATPTAAQPTNTATSTAVASPTNTSVATSTTVFTPSATNAQVTNTEPATQTPIQPTATLPTPSNDSVPVLPSGQHSLDVQVKTRNDDAEETASGKVYLNSSDLELIYDTKTQIVGIRFTGVNLPQNAEIVSAYLQFMADESSTEPLTLQIQGEASANPAAFIYKNRNLSSRPRTTALVAWSPAAWNKGERGVNQATPNLAPIIQELVNLPNWTSGNALVIFISGTTGKRIAEAFEGGAARAPNLHVEYNEASALLSMPTETASAAPTATLPATTTQTLTSTETASPIPATPTATFTNTPEPTATSSPTETATPTATFTNTPEPTATNSPTPTATPASPTDILLSNTTVDENQAANLNVASLSATDPDSTDGFTYALIDTPTCSGVNNAAFEISASDLKATTSFDYEMQSAYTLCIRVTDAQALNFDKAVTININNVNEAPAMTLNNGEQVNLNLDENALDIAQLTAADPDANTIFVYSIVGGADAERFSIDSASGKLTFNAAPDFETPTDADMNNVYEALAQVSDGALNATQAISVTIAPVNDNAPTITPVIDKITGKEITERNVDENSTKITSVSAQDLDLPAETLTFSISGGADAAKFSIDEKSGELAFKSAPDFETPKDADANNIYEVSVQVSDGTQNAAKDITVKVLPLNDNAPSFISNTVDFTLSLAEDTLKVIELKALDADLPNDSLTFAISGGADASLFKLEADLKTLSFISAPDFENPKDADKNNVYEVKIRVTDTSGKTAFQTLLITISNVNE
ncbi:MAG: cadherin domain-containing protein [Anaerolineales bacterium]|nr:cadherin domain-containing protein [Anaerolineales bacterium]MCZ2121786.1 cadherin domain-containing protein [Anaerolineales bacterium]